MQLQSYLGESEIQYEESSVNIWRGNPGIYLDLGRVSGDIFESITNLLW